MPDHSFPESKSINGFHSVISNLVGVEQKSSFPLLVDAKQESWRATALYGRYYQPDINHSLLRPLGFHAEPLAPLRQRDEQALEELFDDSQVEEMMTDIHLRLKQLCPEPCWEDDPFDFLAGYV